MDCEIKGKGGKEKMDAKRTKILIRSLFVTGKLVNEIGAQFWHENINKEKEIRW